MKPSVVSGSRGDEDEDQKAARAWVQQAASRAKPRTLEVSGSRQVLFDPLQTLPATRRKAFAKPPKFVAAGERRSGPASRASAIAHIRDCPPLEWHFEELALGHLASLERKLFLEEAMDTAERSRIRKEIAKFESASKAVWETWIDLTPSAEHSKFDEMILKWLQDPPHEAETEWFEHSEESRADLAIAAGSACFEDAPPLVTKYLGVELIEVQDGATTETIAALDGSPDEFNRRAQAIGFGLRLKS